MSRKKALNLHRDQADWRGQFLCPLKEYRFTFDEHSIASIEGFMLTLRLPANDTRRIVTLMEDIPTARRVARKLKLKSHTWWNNVEYNVDSEEFEKLFERMMRARFRKDRRAVSALMASRGRKFVHMRPHPRSMISVVPIKLYCRVLAKFRRELFRTGEIAKTAAWAA